MATSKKQKWIDISVPIKSGMHHWPDNPPVVVGKMLEMCKGAVCNVSTLSMGSHTGTHMDAPLHFIADGESLDRMPIEATVGPARVVQIKDPVSIKVKELKPLKPRRGERLLFKTRNSVRSWAKPSFDEDFVFISRDAAKFLADSGVQTVGVDYLSVGGFREDGIETHHALLGAGIWIIEGLDFSKVKPGRYELLCLPLKVLDSDGAPARAVLRSTR